MTTIEKYKSLTNELHLERAGYRAERIGNVIISRPYNANTIASDLKRVAWQEGMLRAFKKQLLALNAFSTAFYNVPLQGTNEVAVPYYALDASSSTDFIAANGYDTFGGTATSDKKITINKRKYQALTFTSDERRRQPGFNPEKLLALKAEKLAVDVWTDILSVVTAANFSTAVFTGAANTFDSDSVADCRKAANTAQWPSGQRALILDDDFDASLLKDSTIKTAFGIQTGDIPKILGFDYFHNTNIPDNSENLSGMIVHPSAIAVAFSPVRPAETIQVSYEIVTDAETGISLEFRRWGNPDMDAAREVVECNYGYIKGEAAGLQRIITA